MKIKLLFNKKFYKNDIKNLINWFIHNYGAIRTASLIDKLKNLGFRFSTQFGISLGIKDLKSPRTKKKLIKNALKEIKKIKRKLNTGKIMILDYTFEQNKIWNKTNNLLTKEITKNFEQTDSLNPIYVMIISGARGNLSQIKQLVGMRGLIADAEGQIINMALKENLKEGIKLSEFFVSCYGARKGVIDTALKTANSGYLTRKLIYATQQQIIKQPNCNTKYFISIKNLKKDKKSIEKLKKKIIGRVLAKNTKFKIKEKIIELMPGQDVCNYLIKKIIHSKNIYILSPLTCLVNTGTCQVCYGWNIGNGRLAELGENVGIIAAQSIGEPGTQLTMRTFHTGGIVNIKTQETTISPATGRIIYNPKKIGKILETKTKEKYLITFKKTKIILLPFKGNKMVIRIPKNSVIFIKNKEKISIKQIIAEKLQRKIIKIESQNKKNKTFIIKSNISGIANENIFNTSKKNSVKSINIKIGNILNYKNITCTILKKELNNIKIFINETKKILKKNKSNNSLNTIKLISNNTKNLKKTKKINKTYSLNKKNQTISLNKLKTKIEVNKRNQRKKLDEPIKTRYIFNRKNLICSTITEKKIKRSTIEKTTIFKLEKNTKKYFKNNELIKKGQPIFKTNYSQGKIEDIVEGLPKIQQLFEVQKNQKINEKLKKQFINLKKKYRYQIATKKSFVKIQFYLLKKLQKVYSNQGVNIADKHFEVIIKQMTSRVIIKKEKNSKLINGEIIPLNKIEKIIKNTTKKKPIYEPIVLGISQITKLNEGFLNSSCFQETTKVIGKSAIIGKIDWLNGLKENIVLGNLIPGGTGKK